MARVDHIPYTPSDADRAALHALGGGAVLASPRGYLGVSIGRCGPHGPVLDLIQAVYEAFPGQAHALLRRRILTTEPRTDLDREVVRVAAKRLTASIVAAAAATPVPVFELTAWARRARARARRRGAMRAGGVGEPLVAWAERLPRGPRRLAERDRPVVAVLFGPEGEVLRRTRNTAGRNRTLHAEVNLVQGWWHRSRRGIPDGATVWTSLQPCRMCAALLVRAAEGALTVCYAQPDTGPFARGTALQSGGLVVERHEPHLALPVDPHAGLP